MKLSDRASWKSRDASDWSRWQARKYWRWRTQHELQQVKSLGSRADRLVTAGNQADAAAQADADVQVPNWAVYSGAFKSEAAVQTDEGMTDDESNSLFCVDKAGYNWVDELDIAPATSNRLGHQSFRVVKNAEVASEPGGMVFTPGSVNGAGVAGVSLPEGSSSTIRVKRIVETSEIINEYHRGAFYLEQDIRFLERRFSCEEREVKELRETFDEWDARMKRFHMVSLCDSFMQTSSSNVLRQHPT